MKKTVLNLVITMFIAGVMVSGCQSSANKVENAKDNLQDARKNVAEAKDELNKALIDSIQQFKKESQEKIGKYEISIAEFKGRIAIEKKENKARYEKKLAELEQKNSDVKKKLDDYKEVGQEKWEAFKDEFNHDMNELGKALKDCAVNSKK